MNYSLIKNLWTFVSAHTEFLDCTIITRDGILQANKILLWIFGSRMVFPKQGFTDDHLTILMTEYSTKEVIYMCQRFVTYDRVNEELDPVADVDDQINLGNIGDLKINEPNFCKLCRKYFVNRKLLMVHVYQCHPKPKNFEFKCIPCNKKFAHKFQLTKHSTLCHSKLSFECTFRNCVKSYKSKKALQLHIKIKHS